MKRFLFILGLALSVTAFSFATSIPSSWDQADKQHSSSGSGQSSSSSVKPSGPAKHPTQSIHSKTPAHPVSSPAAKPVRGYYAAVKKY